VIEEVKILLSKSIFTGLSETPFDGALALSGASIIGVGPREMISEFPGAKIVDYGDQTIMASFHDSHIHLLMGAMSEKGGFLRDDETEEAAAKHLYEINKDGNEDEWLLGGAWDHFKWPGAKLPSRESLDKYFPNRRVYLLNKECHGAWVNSRALDYLGIGKDTPDPEFGEIFRDENGIPTGYLHELAGIEALMKIFNEIPEKSLGQYVTSFEKTAFACGITAVGDMQLSGITSFKVFEEMEKSGALGIRIHYFAPFKWDIPKLLELKDRHKSSFLQFAGTKEFVDGTPMGYTGLMCEPYSDRPDFYGTPAVDLDYLEKKVCELEAVGIDVRVHCCGDGAVKVSLDAFENAAKINKMKGTRHAIEHIESIQPTDIRRFGELGVIASVQPEHLPKYDFYNHPFQYQLGKERMRWSWPFNSLQNAGGRLAFGSDYCVADLNPMRGIFRAVTRLTNEGEPENGFSPPEKMTLAESLRAYTLGAAFVDKREHDLGSLEAGKCADIAVLDCNIFEVPPEQLINVKVATTYLDGKIVFEA